LVEHLFEEIFLIWRVLLKHLQLRIKQQCTIWFSISMSRTDMRVLDEDIISSDGDEKELGML
jgi:hypothetical protein